MSDSSVTTFFSVLMHCLQLMKRKTYTCPQDDHAGIV